MNSSLTKLRALRAVALSKRVGAREAFAALKTTAPNRIGDQPAGSAANPIVIEQSPMTLLERIRNHPLASALGTIAVAAVIEGILLVRNRQPKSLAARLLRSRADSSARKASLNRAASRLGKSAFRDAMLSAAAPIGMAIAQRGFEYLLKSPRANPFSRAAARPRAADVRHPTGADPRRFV